MRYIKYLDKRTGEKYDSLLEAQNKLGIFGYIDAVEGGYLEKDTSADELSKKLSAKPKEADE